MKKTKPASADQSPMAKITGARLTRIFRGNVGDPAAIYTGDAPSIGDTLRLVIGNTEYSGIVLDATASDGQVIVEFVNGLTAAT